MTHSLPTRLAHAGRTPGVPGGQPVNPPVVRASTVLFESVAQQREMRTHRNSERLFTYGARGNPTSFALEDMVTMLEGGYRTRLFPTGLAAAAMTLLAYVRPGQHVLLPDCVYEPVRNLADGFLRQHGIATDFYAADGSGLAARLRPETRLVYVEAPGSLAYEMCDLPAIAALAHAHGALVAADNTWGSGLLYRPLELGADISLMAATKYLSGHSDVMMGTVCTTEAVWQQLSAVADAFGMTVSPDDAYLVQRGIRSLGARLAQHQEGALAVANWLRERPEVAQVFCPALSDDPHHALWRRDCHGTNGLLSFTLRTPAPVAAERFVDSLQLFGIGASWGGFESLAMLADMRRARSVTDWSGHGTVIRLHIGLEGVADLLADLEQAFAAIAQIDERELESVHVPHQ
ncbi:cystathionine beta-lyase [Cupriavidus consociatus]|uniref:cystathionine beta-lyase n=1 Tax=Cupriavidus consociatus TaxID=2821357 RepID=UPI001AE3883D|nr:MULTISPECIES: cystathionine beta-lyase [unclassified Cupriavidus]MBP0624056.1 cystathionine beta-lyase [Cupriavidus sp. LEh25]MDK2660766.1 cystathionine beta-lyase [Cupriavidus sp. LEh21]